MPTDDQDQNNSLGQSTDDSAAVSGSTPGQIPNVPSVTEAYPPSPAPQSPGGVSSTDTSSMNSGSGMGSPSTPTTTNPSGSSTASPFAQTTDSTTTSPSLGGSTSPSPLSMGGQDSPSTASPLSSTSPNPIGSSVMGVGSTEKPSAPSILDPTSKPDKDENPSIVPGTPGNQISPPEKAESTSLGMGMPGTMSTPPMSSSSMNMGSPSPTTPPMSTGDSPASGQPLHTSDPTPSENTAAPLKAPPMPGAPKPDDGAKTDENNPGTPPSPANVMSSTSSGSSGGKFKIFVILLIVVTVIVYGVVAYLYFTKDSEDSSSSLLGDSSVNKESMENGTNTTPTAVPTPVITTEITINNGDVVSESSLGDVTVLVKKNDYPESGIVGFSGVNVSSDGSMLCFYSLSPADEPSLYTANSDGTNVLKIADKVSSCLWSEDNSKLAYTNTADSTKPVDIFVYDATNETSSNVTSQLADAQIFRRYDLDSWDSTGTKINCNFVEVDTQNTNEESLGNCEVDVATGEVLDL